jgi:hypothetical protein
MKSLKLGNPLDSKTVGKDVATVAGIAVGALACDLVDRVPYLQGQNQDVVDGAFLVGGAAAFMSIKSDDTVSTVAKMFFATVSIAKGYKLLNRKFGPFGLPAGANSSCGKLFGMNKYALKSTSQRMFALPEGVDRFQGATAQTVDAFAMGAIAQG